MPKAFQDIIVVDFSQVLAGPYATQQLALLGADVIKVEPINGEGGRHIRRADDSSPAGMSAVYLSVNSGKRSMTLDLKHADAKQITERLIARADVIVQNYKVGVMDRLGLGYAEAKAIREDIVYCSISGYGSAGARASAPAYDPAVQAASGMMQLIGTDDTGPLRVGFPLVDMSTGLNAAIAIMGALFRRQATGQGQHLDVAMLDSAMSLLSFPYMQWQQTGVEPERLGNQSQLKSPTAEVFPTADGHIQVTAITEGQTAALFDVLGLSDVLTDTRFDHVDRRSANSDALRPLLEDAFTKHGAQTWENLLSEAEVPASAVLRLPEAVEQPQMATRDFLSVVDAAAGTGPIRVFNAPYDADVDGPSVARPPPAVGEHTLELLGELGFDANEIDALRSSGVV